MVSDVMDADNPSSDNGYGLFCGSLTPVSHAVMVSYHDANGTSMWYNCRAGYRLAAPGRWRSITCEDGEWPTDVPQCQGRLD